MHTYEANVKSDSDYYFYTPTATAKNLFFYPVCLGYFYYEPDYFIRREHYDSFLIMLVTKGSCLITVNGTSFIAEKGDVVLLDCYAPHQYESQGEWEASWLHFDGPLARNYYEQISTLYGNLITPRNLDVISHSLSKIFHTFRNSNTIIEASISKYIVAILTELLLSKGNNNTASTKQNSLSEIITFINESFAEPITLQELASRANLSLFYFTRIFTKEIGMTPHQYLIATRLNSAKFLLISTTMSVKEIAYKTGFTSESSFCSTFKKWEHTTPSQYRSVATL